MINVIYMAAKIQKRKYANPSLTPLNIDYNQIQKSSTHNMSKISQLLVPWEDLAWS